MRSGLRLLATLIGFTFSWWLLGVGPALADDPPPETNPSKEDESQAPEPAPSVSTGPAPAGWTSSEAFELASGAVAADQVGRLDECISKNKRSLRFEEQPRTRLHLASCETRSGKLIDALSDSQKALKFGIERRDVPVMRAARARITDLLGRIPHVTFVAPPLATEVTVTFDGRSVPVDALTKRFSIDPGKHAVHAEGTVNAIPLTFDKDYDVQEGELVTVEITLAAPTSEFLTGGQLKCMLAAKTQEEVVKCLPQEHRDLVVKAGFEIGGYSDTDHVSVFSPSINSAVSSPTAGWNVGATYLLDVVTAASPDIVSEASGYFREVRNAGIFTAGYKPGLYGVQATGNVSREPDYLSAGGGLAVTADLSDKRITPRLEYNYTHNVIGRSTTPFSVFHHDFDVTDVEGSTTFVLSPTSLLLTGLTVDFERGDQSKPYRYVPMFDASVAGRVPIGAIVDVVNSARLPIRPLEQLPTERNRYALGVRFAHRFSGSTLRLEQRLYYDTWLQFVWTTDVRYIVDASRRVRLWPHLRFNAQNGADFYKLAYVASINPATNRILVPTYRTDDRELSPLATLTVGGGAHIDLSPPTARTQYGLSVQGDTAYTRFYDALFVVERWAFFGTLGFDAEFQ